MNINLDIECVLAPPQKRKLAEELLAARVTTDPETGTAIRKLAKAYIDEADEIELAVKQIQANDGGHIQLDPISPAETIELAKRLTVVTLDNPEHQRDVRGIATSYVMLAEVNQKAFDEFKAKYGPVLPFLQGK